MIEPARAAAGALAAHGRCLIVDCHSFPSRPLPYELAAAADPDTVRSRPAVCIGTDGTCAPQRASALGGLHTPSWLRELADDVFTEMLVHWSTDRTTATPRDAARLDAAAGKTVAFDRPFADTIVPLRFLGKDARVLSLMIELRRDLYMDETSGGRLAGFAECAAAVQAGLRRLIAAVT